MRRLLPLVLLLSACAPRLHDPGAPTAADALARASRAGYIVRVYSTGGGAHQGRVAALGGGAWRIGAARVDASAVDSVFLKPLATPAWRPIAAGMAIGSLTGLFAGEARSFFRDVPTERWQWFAGGALAGGLIGLALAPQQEPAWRKAWPE